jgi:cell division protein FtsZ
VTIPNDKVLSLIDKTTPLTEAFQVIDEVLLQAIQGIASLITVHGVVNVDFADVKSVMTDAGTALMGIGYGTGDSRAAEAARAAIDSPLLESSINGAKGLLLNITGGSDLSMFEIDEAARIVTEAADPEANIIFGAVIDENHTGEVKCTVVATGFDPATAGRTTSKASSFSRSSLGGETASTPSSSATSTTPEATESTSSSKYNQEELEVPAFMRKPLN